MEAPPQLHRHHSGGDHCLYPPILSPNNAHGTRESGFSLYPPLFSHIPLKPRCCGACVHRVMNHHLQHYQHAPHSQPFRQMTFPYEQSAAPPPAVDSCSGPELANSSKSTLVGDEVEEQEDEEIGEGEEDIYVLTDEWAEFFAKSEAKRQLERRRRKNQKRVASD